mmetsp:Transcript_2168/g.2418  ORF Transcript_2168/g.2418 Transcript_2168/m.2418 type:complete len:438 (-) Transcript_2168:54-1367(-)
MWAHVILLSFLCFHVTYSKVAQGSLKTDKNFHYITKFCYAKTGPPLEFTITLGAKNMKNTSKPVFAMYMDYPEQSDLHRWKTVYKNKALSCEQKVNFTEGNVVPIVSGKTIVTPQFTAKKPMYWFFAIADCASDEGIDIEEYNIHMVNYGLSWDKEFSYDEIGMVDIFLAFFLIYCLGACFHVYGIWKMYKIGALHAIVKILSTAIALEMVYLFCSVVHYCIYISNGVGSSGFKGFGDLSHMASVVILMFLTILLGKGWAITSSYLTHRMFMVVAIACLTVAHMTLFIWDVVGRDPASTSYFYDSVPGIFVLVLRVLTWFWFLWSIFWTYKLEAQPQKRRFYIILSIGLSVWYLSLIVFVVMAAGMAPWVPKKITIVTALVLFSDTLAFAVLNFLLWPTRASSYFEKLHSEPLGSQEKRKSTGAFGAENHLISDENL